MANENAPSNDPSLEKLNAVSPAKSGFQISQDPVIGEQEAESSPKFTLAPEAEPSTPPATAAGPDFEDLGTLPASYGEDTLFLVARDPRWLFAYWDFDWANFPSEEMRFGYAQFFLKILRGGGEHVEAMVEINPSARNWYVPVSHPDAEYGAELGYFDAQSSWRTIAASGSAHTPPDALAEDWQPVDFATVPAHLTFERMLELMQERMSEGETLLSALGQVAGEGRLQFQAGRAPAWTDEQKRLLAALLGETLVDRVGLGSEEIDRLLRKQLSERLFSESASGLAAEFMGGLGPSTQSLFSAIGASWSAQPFSTRTERGFYLHVNAEIIFYGGTHPDATVTIRGERIALQPDGSFRYHFTLPDGDFEIPVVATSPDRVEQRSATLSFQRGTQRLGEVGATGQPAQLSPLIGRKN